MPAIKGPFLFDDEHFIQKNEYVLQGKIKKIYSSSVTEGAGIKGNFYRPNQQVVYAFLNKMVGLNSIWFHLMNVCIHIVNAILLFTFFKSILSSIEVAFIGAGIFLIHPIHTEAVSYISGLADPLSLMFLLISLCSYHQIIVQKKIILKYGFFILTTVFVILALFTKENMVVIFPLLVWYYLYIRNFKKPGYSLEFFLLFVVGVLALSYVYLKFSVFNFSESLGLTTENNAYTKHLSLRISTFLNVFPNYIQMFFFPWHLHYEKPYVAFTNWVTYKAVISYIFGITLLYLCIKRHKYPIALFGLGFFILALLPFTGIIPLNAMYLEHWLYVPSIGAIISICFILLRYPIYKHPVLKWILVLFFILFSVRTFLRNQQWENIEAFYLNEINYLPSTRVYNNLAMYYSDNNKPHKAIQFYKKSIQLNDAFPQPHHNLGNVYLDMQEYNLALEEWKKALWIDPNFLYTWNALYHFFTENKEFKKAELIYQTIQYIRSGKNISNEQLMLLCNELKI